VEWLAAAQGLDLRNGLKTSTKLEQARAILRREVPFYEKDRFFAPDINAATELLASRTLNELVPANLLPSL
jgi:histidine ammonia-lyase